MRWDVMVVGAGHAGCEAALAAARLGAKVGLVTLRRDRVAQMSCNPAIGGVGKGHLVREIDALGGAMARVADATGIQYRRLNLSRGPAVRSTRCQSDSARYRAAMTAQIESTAGIDLAEDEVVDLVVEGSRVVGVVNAKGHILRAGAVIITTGTFLNGLCHVGSERFEGGRIGDAPAKRLSDALRRVGLALGRFKTGTTPRLAAESIGWDRLEPQLGDSPRPHFSFDRVTNRLPQIPCFITHTETTTHEVVRDNLRHSPLFLGIIQGLGPRYCPSLEDKIVRFPDRDRHQIFLEPEGLDSERVYPNGLSTSLPKEIQERFLRTIPGLEQVRVLQHGYAVEYDYAPPTQLNRGLMVKCAPGLFLAGQINGTSGYEEAAAQGLMAGLNAVRFVGGSEPAVLGRHEAYIGVLIDDLVTRGVDEPYRVFTARAEHRLTLRESNAEVRLGGRGERWGLLSEARRASLNARMAARRALHWSLRENRVTRPEAEAQGWEAEKTVGLRWEEVLRRPDVTMSSLGVGSEAESDVAILVEEEVKYAGYIAREAREIERLGELETVMLPPGLNLEATSGLSVEVREKLAAVRPTTLGQASRIPGVTPAALAILRVQARRCVSRETTVKTSMAGSSLSMP